MIVSDVTQDVSEMKFHSITVENICHLKRLNSTMLDSSSQYNSDVTFYKMVLKASNHSFLLSIGDLFIGGIGCFFMTDSCDVLCIATLCVISRFQRKGYGSSLVSKVISSILCHNIEQQQKQQRLQQKQKFGQDTNNEDYEKYDDGNMKEKLSGPVFSSRIKKVCVQIMDVQQSISSKALGEDSREMSESDSNCLLLLKFYERHGFILEAKLPNYYRISTLNKVVKRKDRRTDQHHRKFIDGLLLSREFPGDDI